MYWLRRISLAAWLGVFFAGFAVFATPAETPKASAAVRGPLVPDSVQCTGSTPGDCRSYVAQPEDGSKVIRSVGDGLQMLWMNSTNFPLIPPGAAVSNVTLIVRAMEMNNSANLLVKSSSDGPQIATSGGNSSSSLQTRELTGPSLVNTVRDAVTSGKDLTLQLTVSPQSGITSPALDIDFVALSIEYQPGAVAVIPSSSVTPIPTSTSSVLSVTTMTPTPTQTGGSGGSGGGSGVQPTTTAGGNPSQSAFPTAVTGGPNNNNSGTVSGPANWLDLPPAVPSARSSCPASGSWALLYWSGASETPIVSASPICSNGDRFWVFRNGRWLGFSPVFPTESDTWNTLIGEAHFVRGRSF
jgi:hypothetical protein